MCAFICTCIYDRGAGSILSLCDLQYTLYLYQSINPSVHLTLELVMLFPQGARIGLYVNVLIIYQTLGVIYRTRGLHEM